MRPRLSVLTPSSAKPSPCCVGHASDAHEHDVAVEGFLRPAFDRLDPHLAGLAVGLHAEHLGVELERDALLGKDALELLRHLAVETWRDAGKHLDHRDLRAEAPPHRAELEPDIACADHHQPLRHFGKRQRTGRGDDRLFVDGDAGDGRHLRAGRDDDGLGFKRLRAAVVARDFDLAWRGDPGGAMKRHRSCSSSGETRRPARCPSPLRP